MAANVISINGMGSDLRIDGLLVTDVFFDSYIDSNGIFNYRGVVIKPSGSIRVGEMKMHPTGLMQVGDQAQIRIAALPTAKIAAKLTKIAASSQASNPIFRALSESSSKANVQPRKTPNSGNDDGATLTKHASLETRLESLGQAAGSKRKSTEVTFESAKKQKTDTFKAPSTSVESRAASAPARSAPMNGYDVELNGQWDDEVHVYESCDQIRRKIEVHLAQPGVTKAQFCRDMAAQFYSHSAPKDMQSNMLEDFRKKHGASGGWTSSVFYAAYVFFEKWRIVNNEAKSKHRLEMEEIWPVGMERDRDVTNRGVWCGPGGRPKQDAYGRWSVRY